MCKGVLLFVLFVLLGTCVPVHASVIDNNGKGDSLKKLLTPSISDSARFVILHNLVFEYLYTKPSDALPFAKEMLRMAEAEKSPLKIAKSYNKLSLIYHGFGDYDKAIEYGFKSMGQYEDLHDTTGIAGALLNLSNVYKSKHEYTKALEILEKALLNFKQVHNKFGLAYTYNNIAILYETQSKYATALGFYSKSLGLKLEMKDSTHLAGTYLNLGIIEQDMKKPDSALYYYQKSMLLSRRFNNTYGISNAYMDLGSLAIAGKNYKTAKVMLDSAMLLASQLQSKEDIQEIEESYHQLYKESGNPEMALEHFLKYRTWKDTLLAEKSIRQSADMAARYESEKKDKDNELKGKEAEVLETQLKKDRVFISGLGVAILGVILFSLLLYNRFRMRKRMNEQLSLLKIQISEHNKEITDSIHYAKRIQESVMLRPERIRKIIPESFLLYRPKQIVSGDFYWVHSNETEVTVVVVDNKLYGVPGAFISLVGINLLNRAVQEENIRDLDTLVSHIKDGIFATLKQTGGGEDFANKLHFSICRINKTGKSVICVTTANPIYVIRNSVITEVKCQEQGTPFLKEIALVGGEELYLFTDGYVNQLGGEDGKKMMIRKLQETLLSGYGKPVQQQEAMLDEVLDNWKKGFEQVDDILLIGFRPD
ncbi:MAG: tetratricopeptide repeat protein [Bacteroidia bacterium]